VKPFAKRIEDENDDEDEKKNRDEGGCSKSEGGSSDLCHLSSVL
jgi:hypothetical protein